jgi:hypothetical protein
MKTIKFFTLLLLLPALAMIMNSCCPTAETNEGNGQWSIEKANAWQEETGWLNGVNFLPSTASNALEFWQKETFDPETIDLELGWAEDMGFNIVRVWLNSLVWQDDPDAYKGRIDEFLTICDSHGIGVMFVFFCDCFNPNSSLGPQPDPLPRVHNSRWVQDPSGDLRTDTTSLYVWLEEYVTDIVSTYKDDHRILVWDLYNEPRGADFPLVRNAFKWAREVNPSQPLTTCLFRDQGMNRFLVKNADIITYHNYRNLLDHATVVRYLDLQLRPMICTEWMARHFDSKFQNILPFLQKANVGAISWGLVAGRTNTHLPRSMPNLEELIPEDGSEPELWFHDILRKDGTPFDQVEIDTIKAVNSRR